MELLNKMKPKWVQHEKALANFGKKIDQILSEFHI